MLPSRRAILAGLATALVPLPPAYATEPPRFVAACRRPDGAFAAAVLGETGEVLHVEPLDDRGHDAAIRTDPPVAVVFARRPGRFALVLDLARLKRALVVAPPANRRFAGHGFFSADGKILFATENDFEGERGVLGLYDATDRYRRIGEFETRGIGPHEALLLADGRTIAVANGGILTHPDFPRMKLNLPTIAPSLALIDARDGSLIARHELTAALHQLSIRHMAEVAPGRVWFGAQYEGPITEAVPLVGTFDPDRGLVLVEESASLSAPMRYYVGSVAASRDGRTVITTSPRGGLAVVWDTARRTVIATRQLPDVCGAAGSASGIALTTGQGQVIMPAGEVHHSRLQWDNHLAAC